MTLSKERLNRIKLLITDVDGVLTDGGLYYSEDGLVMKKFNVKDGMGVRRLKEIGIECGIISTDEPNIIMKRNERLKMDFIYTGVWDKKSKLNEICEEKNITPDNVAFIGDDVNDIEIINAVGISAAPMDAVDDVLKLVDYVCKREGGKGAFREFAELLIAAHR